MVSVVGCRACGSGLGVHVGIQVCTVQSFGFMVSGVGCRACGSGLGVYVGIQVSGCMMVDASWQATFAETVDLAPQSKMRYCDVVDAG